MESHKAVSHGNYAYLKQFVLAEGGFIGCKFCNNSYSFSKVDSVVAHIGRMHMKDVKILEDAMVVGAGVEELTVEVDADDFPLKDEDDQSVGNFKFLHLKISSTSYLYNFKFFNFKFLRLQISSTANLFNFNFLKLQISST